MGADSSQLERRPLPDAIRDDGLVNILEKTLTCQEWNARGNFEKLLDCKAVRKKVDRDDCSAHCGDLVESVILH